MSEGYNKGQVEKLSVSINQEIVKRCTGNLRGIVLGIVEAAITDPAQLKSVKLLVDREILRCSEEICHRISG